MTPNSYRTIIIREGWGQSLPCFVVIKKLWKVASGGVVDRLELSGSGDNYVVGRDNTVVTHSNLTSQDTQTETTFIFNMQVVQFWFKKIYNLEKEVVNGL